MKMKIFDKIVILAIVVALSHTEEEDDDKEDNIEDNKHEEKLTAFNYHTKIGIPKAAILGITKSLTHDKLNIITEIVGGQVTHVKDIPYQVGLIITLKIFLTSVCGGSLISSSRVLTVGHCYYDGVLTAKFFEVVLGSSKLYEGGQRIKTADISVHPKWNPKAMNNDLAILRIAPVTFSLLIQPIGLPRGEMLSYKFAGWTALTSGYGITGDDKQITISQHLSSVNVTIISNADCATVFQDLIKCTTICTQGDFQEAACQGDSGGPLVVTFDGKPILVGATSFGADDGCEKGFPVAYTRISSYVDWIIIQ